MKKIFLSLFLFCIIGCIQQEPEFYKNGKGYYTKTYCDTSHSEYGYVYHYGYNPLSGKTEGHWGYGWKTVCDKQKTDTIEIEK